MHEASHPMLLEAGTRSRQNVFVVHVYVLPEHTHVCSAQWLTLLIRMCTPQHDALHRVM